MASTVVASAYDTSGNGGRKIVRLSNGWLVASAYQTGSKLIFYKSVDDGVTWTQLCYINWTGTTTSFAICSNGTMVYGIAVSSDLLRANSFKFDATTVTNTSQATTLIDDIDQSSFGSGVSICMDGNGYLHVAYCTKRAAYASSFNLRYSKSTNGGTSWASPTQITTINNSILNITTPCIVVRSNNNPIIIAKYQNNTSHYIVVMYYNGTSWTGDVQTGAKIVYSGGTYVQSNPCVAVDSNDNIHVVWYGMDSVNTAYRNIRYAKSSDGGITWTKADGTAGYDKLTSGNYHQDFPTLTIDKSNKIYVFWSGQDAISAYRNIFEIILNNNVWGSITKLTSNTTAENMYPSVLWSKFNMNSDDAIRWIWQDNQTPSVKYDSIKLLWSHKLLGVNTPSKIMGINPSKVMGVA